MPILRQFDFNTALVNEVLDGIYSTVILRDVLERNKSTDHVLMNKLVLFLADNIGNVLSNEGEIKQGKNNIAGKTVEKFLRFLFSKSI